MKKCLYALLAVFSLASCLSKQDVLQSPRVVKPGGPTHRAPRQHQPRNTPPAKPATSLSGLAYIEQYKDIAIAEMEQYGIPASIKLAQALLESGNGNSTLAREANNHFGIKCTPDWRGRTTRHNDDRRNECFRVYERVEDSFHDHSQFLLRNRYAALFKLDKDDYKGWARGLKAAGYATNPRYADLLISLIERYELYRYDHPQAHTGRSHREAVAQAGMEKPPVGRPATVTAPAQKTPVEATPVEATPAEQPPARHTPAGQPPAEEIPIEEVKEPVRIEIHEVKAGDTLASIARKYGMETAELMDLNGLTTESVFVGQLILVSQ